MRELIGSTDSDIFRFGTIDDLGAPTSTGNGPNGMIDLMDARALGTPRRQRVLAAGLQAAAAIILFTGVAILFAVTLVEDDVLEARENAYGSAGEVARWFVRVSEAAGADPLAWYVPRILVLVGSVGLLLFVAHRIERDEPLRRPFD